MGGEWISRDRKQNTGVWRGKEEKQYETLNEIDGWDMRVEKLSIGEKINIK